MLRDNRQFKKKFLVKERTCDSCGLLIQSVPYQGIRFDLSTKDRLTSHPTPAGDERGYVVFDRDHQAR